MMRALGVALALLFFGLSAAASPKKDARTVSAVGLVCDTAQQVERYVELYRHGASAQTAMDTVNTEQNDAQACQMVTAVFIIGSQVGMLSVAGRHVQIVQITIIAKKTDTGWRRTPPIVQHTAVFSEATDV